jgi:hypothetical protein
MMCNLCGVLAGDGHWTEAPPVAAAGDPAPRWTRRQERRHRVDLTNRILRHYGLALADWNGTTFVLRGRTGRCALVPHLGAVWAAAERLTGRRCDPLDPALLAAVERG